MSEMDGQKQMSYFIQIEPVKVPNDPQMVPNSICFPFIVSEQPQCTTTTTTTTTTITTTTAVEAKI